MLTLIVNDTEFGIKEKHMTAFNDLLKPFRRTIAQFIRYCANAHKAELFPDEVPLASIPFRDVDPNNAEPTVVDLSNWKAPLTPKKASSSSEQIESHDRKISTTSKGSNELSQSVENGKKPSVTSFEGLKKLSSNELPEIVERESSNEGQNPFSAPPASSNSQNMEIELQGPKRRQAIRKQSDTAKVSLQGLMFDIKARALLAEGDELDILEKVADTTISNPTTVEPPSPAPVAIPEPKAEPVLTNPSPPSTLTKKITTKHAKEKSVLKEEDSLSASAKESEAKPHGRSITLAKIKGMMPSSFSPRGSISDRNPFKNKAKAMAEAEMDTDILAFFDILCKSFSTLKKDIEIQTAQMQEPEKTECEKRGKRFLTLLMSGYKDKS